MTNKEKVLYISGRKYLPSRECSEWYESFKSALSKDEHISMEKNKIETPYAIIEFVHRKSLFTREYDIILKANKQDDDAKLFAIAIGKPY